MYLFHKTPVRCELISSTICYCFIKKTTLRVHSRCSILSLLRFFVVIVIVDVISKTHSVYVDLFCFYSKFHRLFTLIIWLIHPMNDETLT